MNASSASLLQTIICQHAVLEPLREPSAQRAQIFIC
jgi:hypothetical protein